MVNPLKRISKTLLSKNFVVGFILMAGILSIFWYMLWAMKISHNTVLFVNFPEFTIYLTIGAIVGLIYAGRATYFRPVDKKPAYIFEMFLSGFALGFVFTLNIFDVYVYLFPDKITHYVSDYEVVFPGPSRGKSGRCEAGLWIKDPHTNRWKQLCTNKVALLKNRKRGMDGVRVTARNNKLGTYIENYHFVYVDPPSFLYLRPENADISHAG